MTDAKVKEFVHIVPDGDPRDPLSGLEFTPEMEALLRKHVERKIEEVAYSILGGHIGRTPQLKGPQS